MKIDFNKYNKGLRCYATLFKINPKVFDTDNFIDIATFNDNFLILKYNNYPKDLINLLENNEFYYNHSIEHGYIIFRFKLKTKEQRIDFALIRDVGSTLCTKKFILDMAILWKDYLDSSFYDIIYDTIL